MCNNYASHVPAQAIAEAAAAMDLSLSFEGGSVPNLEPSDDIRIGDRAPLLVASEGGAALVVRPWAWKSPQGKPVFNFRSEGRRFANSGRCLIPASAFFEFTGKTYPKANLVIGDTLWKEQIGMAFAKGNHDLRLAVNGALKDTLIPSADNAELKALLETGLVLFTEHQKHAEHLAGSVK